MLCRACCLPQPLCSRFRFLPSIPLHEPFRYSVLVPHASAVLTEQSVCALQPWFAKARAFSKRLSTWRCAAPAGLEGERKDFTLAVSTVMGLESVVKQELAELGYPEARPVGASGRVEFPGGSKVIVACNLHLRSVPRLNGR
jgi:hypothetical protein